MNHRVVILLERSSITTTKSAVLQVKIALQNAKVVVESWRLAVDKYKLRQDGRQGHAKGMGWVVDEGVAREVQLPLAWVGVEELPIFQVNQFIGQSDPQGELFVTFGQMTMPPLLGTPEQQAAQLEQVAYVPIKPVVRLGFTKSRLEELIGVLQQTISNYDQARRTTGRGEQG